jgi:hypothetical protein
MLTIYARLDAATALRRGHAVQPDRDGYVAVMVDDAALSPEDRALLADHLHQDSGRNRFTIQAPHLYPFVPEPTAEGLIEVIKEHTTKLAAEEAKKAADRARQAEAMATGIAARREKIRGADVSVFGKTVTYPQRVIDVDTFGHAGLLSAADEEALTAWRADVDAANAAAKAEAQAEGERLYAEEVAKCKAEDAVRAAWIEAYGSTRLKRLLKEKIEHAAVYRDERLALERPGWAWQLKAEDTDAPRNPPEAALDLLDEARAQVPDAKLVYVRSYRKATEDEWDEADGDGEIAERCYKAQSTFMGHSILTKKQVALD